MDQVAPGEGSGALADVLVRYFGGAQAVQKQLDTTVTFGTLDANLGLLPDRWTGPAFPPAETAGGLPGYRRAEHLPLPEPFPPVLGEKALEGVHDTGDGSDDTLLEHAHPWRPLAPGDRVLVLWVQGVPFVAARVA